MANTQLPTTRSPGAFVPATKRDIARFREAILSSFKVPSGNVIADPDAFVAAMAAELSRRYPSAILFEAYRRALAKEHWMPDTAVMVSFAEEALTEARAGEEQRQHDEEQRRHEDKAGRREQARERVLNSARAAFEQRHPDAAEFFDEVATILTNATRHKWLQGVQSNEPWADAAVYLVLEKPFLPYHRGQVALIGLRQWVAQRLMLPPTNTTDDGDRV